MPTNIQEIYVNTVRPLPAIERRRLADLILQDLAQPPENGSAQEEVLSQTPLSLEEREAKRQQSIVWIKAHRAEYGGLYVALDGDKLIGTGQRYGEARAIARQKGYPDAFIGDVLPLDYEGYMGGWEGSGSMWGEKSCESRLQAARATSRLKAGFTTFLSPH